jgi:hypothetical protein
MGDVGLDECIMYEFYASNAQRSELWNSGAGRTTLVTGASASDVAFWYHFDHDGADTVLVDSSSNAHNGAISGTHYAWSTGGIGAGQPTGGLKCMYFENGEEQEIEFTQQIKHQTRIGSELPLHLHIKLDGALGTGEIPTFCLEYLIWNVYEKITDTITIETKPVGFLNASLTDEDYQMVLLFPPIPETNQGNDVKISAMAMGRLYRKANDTYNGGVFLLQADFHLEEDSNGSRTEWAK